MLHSLKLQNFILIDACEIHFQEGFNVLSGETGAGKTLVIQAIAQAFAKKTDPHLVQKEAEKASIEMAFSIDALPELCQLLESSGIECDPHELLIIRRELSAVSKTRAWVNGTLCALSLLEEVGSHLFELISQHSGQSLRLPSQQRALIDLYGDLSQQAKAFEAVFSEKVALEKKLSTLGEERLKRARELELLQWQRAEIDKVNPQESDRNLFQEYELLAHRETHLTKLNDIQSLLSGEESFSVFSHLSRIKKLLSSLALSDTMNTLFHSAYEHLNEFSYEMSRLQEEMQLDPVRLSYLEKRLRELFDLKKKYGDSVEKILAFREELQTKISSYQNLDDLIQSTGKDLEQIEKKSHMLADELSLKRKQSAESLERHVTEQLRSLNMRNALFTIHIAKTELSLSGQDRITFLLQANPGEAPTSIETHASGGEISRILFALKVLLAKKEHTPTLIFDEIDANIGGETATLIGKKLHTIGKGKQVLCITHFAQVAYSADCHLCIKKRSEGKKTSLTVTLLNAKEKKQELLRMLGGKSSLLEVLQLSS